MKTTSRRISSVHAAFAAVLGLAVGSVTLAQPQPATRTTGEAASGVVKRAGKVHEPAESLSAQLRREAADRLAFRELIGWDELSDDAQEDLWDALVGPDQLDDGHGKAQIRPSLRESGEFDPRGGDFGDRGIPLVTLSWLYTPSLAGTARRRVYDMVLNYEGDVVLAGGLDGAEGFRVVEIDGTADATQGWTQNWAQEYDRPNTTTPGWYAVATDLLGNTYAAGFSGRGTYPFEKYNGATGNYNTLSEFNYSASTQTTGTAVSDMAVDPEGMIYVCGSSLDASGRTRWFVARHDPRNAGFSQNWITYIPAEGRPDGGIKINRFGEVFVAGSLGVPGSNLGDFAVVRLNPIDGVVEWTFTDPTPVNDSALALELDFAGNPHVTGSSGGTTRTLKIDRVTGALTWRSIYATGGSMDLKVDDAGNVYVVGREPSPRTIRTIKYNAAGTQLWTSGYGTTGTGDIRVALDWIGNPYVTSVYGGSVRGIDTQKLNPATGAIVWQQAVIPNFDNNEVTDSATIAGIVVDAGGSVYVSGDRFGVRSGQAGGQMYCIRYEQPYVSIPQIARSYPVVKIEGNSLWSPANPDGPGFGFANQSFNLFSFNVGALLGNLDASTQAEIDYGIGTAGGGLDINISNTIFSVAFETEATGGSYDATATGELAIAIPGEEELNVGQPFDIVMNFDPDAAGMELITNARPALKAGLVARARANMDFSVFGRDSVLEAFGAPNPFFDVGFEGRNIDMNQTIIGLDALPIPPGGTWLDLGVVPVVGNYVGGRVRFPDLGTEGYFTEASAGPTLSSRLSETFFEANVSVTNLLSQIAIGVPLSAGYGSPAGNNDFDASVEIGILQAYLEGNIKLEQDLDLVMRPYVDLNFDDASVPDTRVYLERVDEGGGRFSYQATHTVGALPAEANLQITPTFGMRASLQNRTGFRFGAFAGFDPLRISAALEIVGVDIIDLDFKPGSLRQDLLAAMKPNVQSALNGGRVNVLNTTSPEFDFPNEAELPAIQVAASSTNNLPQLIGSSRASARMLMYDQRTPTLAEFNDMASGTEPMILYGRKFFTGVGGNRVRIRHHGRTEALVATRLNDQALLVQIPRRFFLLPGIARIWVFNNNGRSETIDLAIEHPMPNFQGIQETIWAGDPRWLTDPVIAVDGGTPAGNDSFITRRDYYTYLRTNLWNPAIMDGASDPNMSATAYFPSFRPWEVSGQNCPPGFPSLVVDGVALERQRPVINDGYFRSRMQQGLYASPGFLTMQLVNPGPGGGPSRTLTIEVPAPKPVLQTLSPSIVPPGSVAAGEELRIVVTGPESVPYFAGYESPKFGNFTPESVVQLNGTNLRTEFVSSSQLAAYIPAASLTTYGARRITVSTPSNGTDYTEQLRSGSGTLSSPVQVASGGVSVPLTLNITWPRPTITGVSNRTMTVNEPPLFPETVNGQTPPDSHNFTILGSNFAPGARVYWDGIQIPATRDSAGLIRATVGPAQVARLGAARLQVGNPASGGSGRPSNIYSVQIAP
ncbi:MAG: hypothetical protein HEQ23_08985 [Tepidisphaera sp.]